MIHFIEFTMQDGSAVFQRADEIVTFIESVHTTKGKDPVGVIYLLLRNNNRVAVVDETLETIREKLASCVGTPVIFHQKPAVEA